MLVKFNSLMVIIGVLQNRSMVAKNVWTQSTFDISVCVRLFVCLSVCLITYIETLNYKEAG